MTLEYAILGFLQYKPHTGYDLKKVFDTSVRHFWSADQSQIYRTLGRLAERGWAEQDVIPQVDRPDRKVYSITDAGREALHRWLSTPIEPHVSRNAGLIQVFFAGQLDDEQIESIFDRASAHLQALLEEYDKIPAQIEPYSEEVGEPREEYFWMLTLEFGIHLARAQLQWIEDVKQRIQHHEHPPTQDK